jgi:UDP-N-acetylmuramoyl-L-alanyl-D-glutamate--2,6-diaminopimelate ligase
MKLNLLLQEITYKKIIGNDNISVANIQFDSRKVEYGSLFVATKGTASDGHDFIDDAIKKGATVIICETLPKELKSTVTYIQTQNSLDALGKTASAWFDYPSRKLTLVGVTGTNGKTTIATLLYHLFRKMGHKVGLLSTVCNYIEDEAIEATHTTPDALALNELLAKMVDAGCEYAFMEVSSHSVDQHRISGLVFDGAIFTNLTRDHIDYHQTFEAYLKAKKTFFDELQSNAFALTNTDDKNGIVMLQNTKAAKKTYSIKSLADFKGKILENNFDGMLLEINGKEIAVPFIGKFNAYNLLAVFGTAVLLGKSEEEVLVNLSTLHPVSGRFETVRSSRGYTAIVDYAHTPDALNNVLSTINQIREGAGQLITVVGCGGNRDKGKRPMMAKEAVIASERVIFTSDNPRKEDPQEIINDMMSGIDVIEKNKVLTIVDRYQAIKTACLLAQKGDVVLVAGKGHENYQIIGETKHHFDDKEVLQEIFNLE